MSRYAPRSRSLVRAGLACSVLLVACGGESGSGPTAPPPSPAPSPVENTTFDIVLQFVGTAPPANERRAFEDAVDRWQAIITADLPRVDFSANPIAAGRCGVDHPEFSGTVDDLHIFVEVEPIDGILGTLAAAAPCIIRSGAQLTVVGAMRFDRDEVLQLSSQGLADVVLHEMAHVLGFGTLWASHGFLENPSLPDNQGADTHFDGTRAIAAFDDAGGQDYAGAKVPVENEQGGVGTRDAHWRESVLDTELMTGFIDAGGNPLSAISIESLADLGYTVTLDPADPYSVPGGLFSTARAEPIWLRDDVLGVEVAVVSSEP